MSALAWAATLIMTRIMSGTERAITTMTYSSIAGVCILSALVPFVWVAPSWHDIGFGILIGIASTAGQWIVVLDSVTPTLRCWRRFPIPNCCG